MGDYQFKDRPDLPDEQQKISPEADMTVFERHNSDQFLILACDGIWDVMSNEDAHQFVLDQVFCVYQEHLHAVPRPHGFYVLISRCSFRVAFP